MNLAVPRAVVRDGDPDLRLRVAHGDRDRIPRVLLAVRLDPVGEARVFGDPVDDILPQDDLAESHRLLGQVMAEWRRSDAGVVEHLRSQIGVAADHVGVGVHANGPPLQEVLDLGVLDPRSVPAGHQPCAAVLLLEDERLLILVAVGQPAEDRIGAAPVHELRVVLAPLDRERKVLGSVGLG